jgi:hypothetical protein
MPRSAPSELGRPTPMSLKEREEVPYPNRDLCPAATGALVLFDPLRPKQAQSPSGGR